MSIEDVLTELATIVIGDDSWWDLEMSEENFEWVLWRVMRSRQVTSKTLKTGAVVKHQRMFMVFKKCNRTF